MTPEGKVLAYARRQAFMMGLIPLRLSMRGGVEVGWPDLIIFGAKGRVMLMEVKAFGGSLSAVQAARIEHMQKFGHDAVVCYGKDDVLRELVRFAKPCLEIE